MSVNEIINKIKEKAKANDQSEVIDEIDSLIKSGSTGSEITAMIGKYLYDIQYTNPNLYKILENEICNYLEYCYKNGLLIS